MKKRIKTNNLKREKKSFVDNIFSGKAKISEVYENQSNL